MLNIGSRRECFFDEYLINTEKTTAEFRQHSPIRREKLITLDKPWEGSGSMSECIIMHQKTAFDFFERIKGCFLYKYSLMHKGKEADNQQENVYMHFFA